MKTMTIQEVGTYQSQQTIVKKLYPHTIMSAKACKTCLYGLPCQTKTDLLAELKKRTTKK